MPDSPKRPRYIELADGIRHQIRAGHYAVGADLPTEADLVASYGVSRFTVREALRLVEEDGLIERHQGRGSRVVAREAPPAYKLVLHSEADVLRYASETSIEFRLDREQVASATVKDLALDPPNDWVRFSGVRRADAHTAPIALTFAYVRRPYKRAVMPSSRDDAAAIFARILAKYGLDLSHVDQVVTAVTLRPQEARQLRAEPGVAALRIVRRFVARQHGLFEVSVSVHPADRFEYSLRIDRALGGG